MGLIDQKVMSGYEFVSEVIRRNRFRAGDNLISLEGGECQWLEFKAVVGIGSDDAEVQRLHREKMISLVEACKFETGRNLDRIAKAIISLYNIRGGCVLIGVCEKDGKPVPTAESVISTHWKKSGFISVLLRLLTLLKGVYSIVKDLRFLRSLKQRCELKFNADGECQSNSVLIEHLFDRKIIFYRSVPIIALVVKCASSSNKVALYSNGAHEEDYLLFRRGAHNETCAWPLVANQANLFEETRNDAVTNDDLRQKFLALSYQNPNSVIRMLNAFVQCFDRSLVASAVTYMFSPVSIEKMDARLRVSFVYYAIIFLSLNGLLIWFPGYKLIVQVLILICLVVAFCEIRKRIEHSWSCNFLCFPLVFILLSVVAPLKEWAVYTSSMGLSVSAVGFLLVSRSPRLKDVSDKMLSQLVTLLVYMIMLVVQYPFILFALSDGTQPLSLKTYILSVVVDFIPVVSSIVAYNVSIRYYDGFFIGGFLLFYMPYVLMGMADMDGITIGPKRVRDVLESVCPKVVILAFLGLWYMLLISIGAIGRLVDDASIMLNPIRTNDSGINITNTGAGIVTKLNSETNNGGIVQLTINDCFAQAVSSYYYSFSNEISQIQAKWRENSDSVRIRRYKDAVSFYYKGLKNIEWSFFGCPDEDDIDDDWLEEDDYFDDDFLSNRRLDIDNRLTTLFNEYLKNVRQVCDSSDEEVNNGHPLFKDQARKSREKLFDQFSELKLKIDWGYIKWINRPRK